jgi:hypothetical protein
MNDTLSGLKALLLRLKGLRASIDSDIMAIENALDALSDESNAAAGVEVDSNAPAIARRTRRTSPRTIIVDGRKVTAASEAEIVQGVKKILLHEMRPLTARELVAKLKEAGIHMKALRPDLHLKAIFNARHRGVLIGIPGVQGYWVAEFPNADFGYDPVTPPEKRGPQWPRKAKSIGSRKDAS